MTINKNKKTEKQKMYKLIFLGVITLYKVENHTPTRPKMEEIKQERTIVDCFKLAPDIVPEDLQKQCEKLFPVEQGASMQTCNNCEKEIRVSGKTIHCVECHTRRLRFEIDNRKAKGVSSKYGPNALLIIKTPSEKINKGRVHAIKFVEYLDPPFGKKMHVDSGSCCGYTIQPYSSYKNTEKEEYNNRKEEKEENNETKYTVVITVTDKVSLKGVQLPDGTYEAYMGDIEMVCRNKINGVCKSDEAVNNSQPKKSYEDFVNFPYIRKANLVVDQGVPKFVFEDYCIHCNGEKSTEPSTLTTYTSERTAKPKKQPKTEPWNDPKYGQKQEPKKLENAEKTTRDWNNLKNRNEIQKTTTNQNKIHHLEMEIANLKAELKQKDIVIQALSNQIAGAMANRVTNSRF